MRTERFNMAPFIERAGENLGTWIPVDYGLEVMCRGEDSVGTCRVRGQGSILDLSVQLPTLMPTEVPGMQMKVWTSPSSAYGVVFIHGLEDAWWWEAKA